MTQHLHQTARFILAAALVAAPASTALAQKARLTPAQSTSSGPAVPSSLRVVPGERIGIVALGEEQAAIRRRLGKPTASFKLNGDLSSDMWRSKTARRWDGQMHTFEVVYRRGVAVQLEATNPHFRTAAGLSLKSSDAAWAKAFGRRDEDAQFTYKAPGKKPQGYEDWIRKGVALEYQILPEDRTGSDAPIEMHTLIVHYRGVPAMSDPGGIKSAD